MAKFLPFVVESSTPIHIFQTLITRSKGINEVLISSMLHLLVDKGITKVRKAAGHLPEGEAHKVYEMLIAQFPQYKVSNLEFSMMQHVAPHVELWFHDEISSELKDYDIQDKMIFLLVMTKIGINKKYSSLHFERLFDDNYSGDNIRLSDTKMFLDSGDEYLFNSLQDLMGYVLCRYVLSNTKEEILPVCAVYSPAETSESSYNSDPYGSKIPEEERFDVGNPSSDGIDAQTYHKEFHNKHKNKKKHHDPAKRDSSKDTECEVTPSARGKLPPHGDKNVP